MMLAPSLALIVALGDSITYGYGLASPPMQNYAALYAHRAHAKIVDLAVPGYQCDEVVRDEIPKMPRGASTVILNCGTNDIGGFSFTADDKPDGTHRTAPANDAEIAAAERTFARALALIRAREPQAKIVLIGVRSWQRMTGPPSPQFARDVAVWNAMLRATGLPVVDLTRDPRMYARAYFQPDLLHPNVAGNAAIASDFPRP
jgi:lysophospholipase L1-like esterase